MSDIQVSYLSIDEIEQWPRNPKKHDEIGIRESLQRFGYVMPMLKDENTGRLVAGHGRLKALQKMQQEGEPAPKGIKSIDGEWLAPVVEGVSFNSEHEAEAYLLADNVLTVNRLWDSDLMAEVLQDHADHVEGTGLTEEEVNVMLDAFSMGDNGEDEEAPSEFQTFDDDIDTDYQCPSCGYEWSGKPK